MFWPYERMVATNISQVDWAKVKAHYYKQRLQCTVVLQHICSGNPGRENCPLARGVLLCIPCNRVVNPQTRAQVGKRI